MQLTALSSLGSHAAASSSHAVRGTQRPTPRFGDRCLSNQRRSTTWGTPGLFSRGCRVTTRAERQRDVDKRTDVPTSPPQKGSSGSGGSGQEKPEELETAFKLFAWDKYAQRFDVPWGAKDTGLGMVAWAAAFTAVGLAFLPAVAMLAGSKGFAGLTPTEKSLYALANQVMETAVSLGIIRLAVAKYEPLSPELFKYDFSAPFRKPDGWLIWGLLGVILAPAVVYAAATLAEVLGASEPSGRGTVDAVSQILSMDLTNYLALFGTTAVLAPVLEETVFRGFLLTSLTKFMPTPAAVAISSIAFGLVHLTPRDFTQLTSLGVLLGFSYVRSRNLLTPILIHGTWNGTVLTILYILTGSGVDIQQLIHQN